MVFELQKRIGVLVFLTTILAAALVACSRDYLPNTSVEDTAENRRILEFVDRYRKAVESRDVAAAAAFLLGESGSYISGQVLYVDGGRQLFSSGTA